MDYLCSKNWVIGTRSGVNFMVPCLGLAVMVIGTAQLYGHSLIMFPSIQGLASYYWDQWLLKVWLNVNVFEAILLCGVEWIRSEWQWPDEWVHYRHQELWIVRDWITGSTADIGHLLSPQAFTSLMNASTWRTNS